MGGLQGGLLAHSVSTRDMLDELGLSFKHHEACLYSILNT